MVKRIAARFFSAVVVPFVVVLVLLNVVFGALGHFEKILGSIINEELKVLRQSLSQSIRDTEKLEQVLGVRQKELESFYGIDKPWYRHLPQNTLRALRLDLGKAKTARSFSGSSDIAVIVKERFLHTVLFMTTSLVIVVLIAIPAGTWLATRAGTRLDRALMIFSAFFDSLPTWWIGILLILIVGVKLGWLPTGGMYSTPPPTEALPRFLDLLRHAALPVATLVIASLGPFVFAIRTIALKVAQEPFVAYARARGIPESLVRRRYIMRVAAPPIATGVTLPLVGSFGGAILTETVFNWPGMGRLYADAILGTPDQGIVLALTMFSAALFLLARFVLDVANIWLDPRIRQ